MTQRGCLILTMLFSGVYGENLVCAKTALLAIMKTSTPQKLCQDMASSHYENFPVGSIWISPRIRPHIHAVYAFARSADDFADEKAFEGQRLQSLSLWREELKHCQDRKSENPIFQALAKTLQETALPMEWLAMLLDAFEQDVRKSRYERFEELLEYAQSSANPIGRMVLWLHGYQSPAAFEYSDAICTALQLANFWQDIAVDLEKDRVYLPEQAIKTFGYSYEELFARKSTKAFQNLLENLIKKTEVLFERGRPLVDLVEGRLRWELRITFLGGMRILEKIRAVDYDVFDRRPTLSLFDKVLLLWRAFRWKAQ